MGIESPPPKYRSSFIARKTSVSEIQTEWLPESISHFSIFFGFAKSRIQEPGDIKDFNTLEALFLVLGSGDKDFRIGIPDLQKG